MYYLTLEEIIDLFGTENGYFFLTVNVLEYLEGIIILNSKGENLKSAINRTISNDKRLLLQSAITYDIINQKNYKSIIGRYNMADQKVVNLKDESYDFSDDSLFNINSWGADLSFRELILMYDDEELIKPELQRKYVWTKEEACKFIDTLLLGLPVPSIFLAKVNEQKLIVDGYQRLMTVYDYVKGIYSATGKVFKLSNSESIHENWRGKAFSELTTDQQRRIKSSTIHAIIFEQKHPANDSGMYQIFERINTSGRNLKPQEIRNCVYHGKLNDLLLTLNVTKSWRELWGNELEDSRMTDMEFILRYFAMNKLFEIRPETKQISLKKELNVFMEDENNNEDNKLIELRDEFVIVTNTILDHLGNIAFRNLSKNKAGELTDSFAKPIHPAIFDAVTVACSQYIKNNGVENLESLTVDNYRELLKDPDFIDCISVRTTNVDKIVLRVSLALKYLFGV